MSTNDFWLAALKEYSGYQVLKPYLNFYDNAMEMMQDFDRVCNIVKEINEYEYNSTNYREYHATLMKRVSEIKKKKTLESMSLQSLVRDLQEKDHERYREGTLEILESGWIGALLTLGFFEDDYVDGITADITEGYETVNLQKGPWLTDRDRLVAWL